VYQETSFPDKISWQIVGVHFAERDASCHSVFAFYYSLMGCNEIFDQTNANKFSKNSLFSSIT
jgi:hypothetical protein